MSDALTVPEVERHVRAALQSLDGLPMTLLQSLDAGGRIADAVGHLQELAWLCELVRNVDAGLVIVVDEIERVEP